MQSGSYAAATSASVKDGVGISIVADKFYHVAYVFDPANSVLKVVVNGAIVDVQPATNCNIMGHRYISVGNVPWGSTSPNLCFNCLRVFKSALGMEEINDVMNACPFPVQVEPKQCRADLTALLDDASVTASSFLNTTYDWRPSNAKSIYKAFAPPIACCWQPSTPTGSWIQFTFPEVKRIASIATKGISDTNIGNLYVTTYYVQTATRALSGAANWVTYLDKVTKSALVSSRSTRSNGFNLLSLLSALHQQQ